MNEGAAGNAHIQVKVCPVSLKVTVSPLDQVLD